MLSSAREAPGQAHPTGGAAFNVKVAFLTRCIRMVSYGAISPVFLNYLSAIGFSGLQTGVLLTGILLGDLVITLYLSTRADALGRRRTLVLASLLKVLAGAAFASTSSFGLLVFSGIVGVISTSGGEIGPFMAVEQAVLTDSLAQARVEAGLEPRTKKEEGAAVAVVIGWYTAAGYLCQALGALASGLAVQHLPALLSCSALSATRLVFFAYAALGGLLALLYSTLAPSCEAKPRPPQAAAPPGDGQAPPACCPAALAPCLPSVSYGLRRPESIHIVARLSALFAMDSFAGAFVMQAWVAFWFTQRWGFSADLVGYLLMGANVVAGLSGVAAAHFVRRYGAMLTMVASHLPSNVLLLAVPLMPSGAAAAAMLTARFSISQMDVPARQAYVQMVVASDERSAAGGITNLVRSLGMSLAPLLLGYMMDSRPVAGAFTLFSLPWVLAGGIKIAYDLLLYGLYLCDSTVQEGEALADASEKREAAAAAAEASGAREAAAATGEEAREPLLASGSK